MSKKTQNARPTVGAAGRAVENGPVCQTPHASTTNDTTSPADRQLPRIADLLLHGEQNALPMKYLKELTGLDSRVIRLMIQSERLSGTPICANNRSGYYLPGNDLERKRFVNSMLHRAMEIAAVAASVEQAEV